MAETASRRHPIDCSIVIVNYHTEALLAECLASLQQSTEPDLGVEVIVVDNSATLNGNLHERFPRVQLVSNPRNAGFARASNQGLRRAQGRHLMLLNPDTVVEPGVLRTLVDYLDHHADVGLVAPRLHNTDGTLQYSCRRFPGYLTVFFGRYSFLTRLLPGNPFSRRYLYQDWDHAASREVDWLSGACLMARRDAMESVGPLDEDYFLFVEDMDWCRRMWDGGWRVVYVPDGVVTHHVGASRGPVTPGVVSARHRSMLRYFAKHFRSGPLVRGAVLAGLTLRAGCEVVLNALAALGAAVATTAQMTQLEVKPQEPKVASEPVRVPEEA